MRPPQSASCIERCSLDARLSYKVLNIWPIRVTYEFLFVSSRWELDLFQNCTDEPALSTYIKETLSSMLNDDRSHRELAVRHDVHLRYMAPKPLAQAVNSFCMKNGLHKESFLVCLESNINWLEHPRAGLGLTFRRTTSLWTTFWIFMMMRTMVLMLSLGWQSPRRVLPRSLPGRRKRPASAVPC